MSIPTPHNTAKKEDIAKRVLMPGDPLRAKFIAENFIDNARCVNEVRNMFAYTGTYKGEPVTIMGSGMGMPSIAIYSYGSTARTLAFRLLALPLRIPPMPSSTPKTALSPSRTFPTRTAKPATT